MPKPRIAPYGTWGSPISPGLITQDALRLEDVNVDGDALRWVEMRPDEVGRHVVMGRRADGSVEEFTPPAFNARTRVHEYGSGAVVPHDGRVACALALTQRYPSVIRVNRPLLECGGLPPLFPDGAWIAEVTCRRTRCPRHGYHRPSRIW